MHFNELFHNTLNVIVWKIPGAKCVVDGEGMNGVLRAGSWEGPGTEPTPEQIAEWTTEFLAADVSVDLEAESKITDAELSSMYAVFEVSNGSPPTDDQKAALRAALKENLKASIGD